jgi:hypothetical protein
MGHPHARSFVLLAPPSYPLADDTWLMQYANKEHRAGSDYVCGPHTVNGLDITQMIIQ